MLGVRLSTDKDEQQVIDPLVPQDCMLMSKDREHRIMAENTSLKPKLSPTSVKSRSLPSTPSQRPQSPPGTRSPNGIPPRSTRDRSPQSVRGHQSRTPPVFRRGVPCKYETGMKQARRRVPYTLGPEVLEPDPKGASKRLNAKEEYRITADMRKLYQQLLPTTESEDRRRRLVSKLETLLSQRWPQQSIKVSVFGSTGNKLGTNESDVDICITTDSKEIEHVCSIADLLARNGMERVVCVSGAKVPIVKVWDPDLQVSCDMNVNNPIALENTELIRSYVEIDDRCRPLAMIIKHWARRRILNDAALGGTLSSYTWICLVINFLQTRSPPILPCLQEIAQSKPHLIGGVNVAFEKDLSRYSNFGTANTSTLGDLLFQFFHYYAHELDFEKSVVSVRLGKVIPKSDKSWHLLQDNRLCVEEPFNISRNLANTADDTSVKGIHLELRRAFDMVAAGRFGECCEQFVPPQPDIQPRLNDTFVPPASKSIIIPQLPPQPQPLPARNPKNKKHGSRGDRLANGMRRTSNPQGRIPVPHHLQHLPFQMTPHELQLQQQHQQHRLHDQLYQQYHLLQLQEQELRLQLMRHRGLVAAGAYSSDVMSGGALTDDDQGSTLSSRTASSSRPPLTAPLYQSRFPSPSMMNGSSNRTNITNSSGIVTNPASPLLATALPDTRRYTRRASMHGSASNSMRAQSQPGRMMPMGNGLPFLTQRFDVPVRQVGNTDTRRSSMTSNSGDPFGPYLAGRMPPQGSRYEAGRRPVEYVGYYVGQSPTVSAHGSATISPVASNAGLAIQNGGISPRITSRYPALSSVTASPASNYLAPTVEHTDERISPTNLDADPVTATPASHRSGPLIVDGSGDSPPRRLPTTRPMRSSSDDLDISVTTSEDVALNTPSSTDGMSSSSLRRKDIDGNLEAHDTEVVEERDYMSLNGATQSFAEQMGLDESEAAKVMRQLDEQRTMRDLTTALAAATVNNGPLMASGHRRMDLTRNLNASPLMAMSNGNYGRPNPNPNEWQTSQSKKKKKNKKSQRKEDSVTIGHGPILGDESNMDRADFGKGG